MKLTEPIGEFTEHEWKTDIIYKPTGQPLRTRFHLTLMGDIYISLERKVKGSLAGFMTPELTYPKRITGPL